MEAVTRSAMIFLVDTTVRAGVVSEHLPWMEFLAQVRQ